jgi:hypothetical protein
MGRLLAFNLHAPAAVIDACTALLKPGARVVNVSSGAGLHAIPWRGAYSPSKAGLIAQTRALAQARPDLCVTVLAPGFVRTELVDGLIQAGRLKPEGAVAKIPLGRMAAPAEMAQALYFLATPGARPLSGQIRRNGGSSIYDGSQPFHQPRWSHCPWTCRCGWGGGQQCRCMASLGIGAHGSARHAGYLDLSPLSCAPIEAVAGGRAAAALRGPAHAQASLTVPCPSDA